MAHTIRFLSLTALLVSLVSAGCSADKTVVTPPTVRTGTIVINPSPDNINAPWTLTSPDKSDTTGHGDITLLNRVTGQYTLSWQRVTGWSRPDDASGTLTTNDTLTFSGSYEVASNPFLDASVATDTTLEVVTWNLEHFPKQGTTTTDCVIEILEGLQVDIVALQEIESASDFQTVVDGLTGWAGYKASSAGYDVDLAFLYRTDGALIQSAIYEILSSQSRELPRAPLVFEGTFNGTPLVVINNHLKCCGDNEIDESDAWDEETRRRDANILLADYVTDNFAGQRVFIVGDFNDNLADDAQNNVFNVFLDYPAVWGVADLDIANGPTSGWSYPSWPSHLDHIFIHGPLLTDFDGPLADVRTIQLHTYISGTWSAYDRNISDHLPVCLKLGF